MADIIDRSSLSGEIPEEITGEIIQGAIAESAVLRMGRRLPNMSRRTASMPVLDMLPTAYFVNAEAKTGSKADENTFKKTSKMAWKDKKLYAEEIAVIIPMRERQGGGKGCAVGRVALRGVQPAL